MSNKISLNLPIKFLISQTLISVLALGVLASCAQSQPLPETKTASLDADALAIKTELVSTPVSSTRAWSTAIAPSARGGWNFITQSHEFRSGRPVANKMT